jgi:hypothetical protein
MQCVRSSSEKFDHCLTSCSRTARSLSMQFFCSCGTAGSWKVTPPCCAMPLHTGTTLSSGTRSPPATSVVNCTPKAIAFGKIMAHSAQPSPPLMLRLQQSTQAKYYLQSSWRRHKELLANQSDFVPIRTTRARRCTGSARPITKYFNAANVGTQKWAEPVSGTGHVDHNSARYGTGIF